MTRWLALALQGLAALMLLAIVLIVLANVVARYFLHVGLGWTEEAARFLLIGMTFVAATVAVRQWGHFQLLIAAKWIPQRWQIAVRLFSIATVLVMAVVLVRYGIAIAQVSWFQTSPTMEWSMGYLYAIVPVSGALMFIFAAEHFWNTLRGQPMPLPGGHGAAPEMAHAGRHQGDEGAD